MGAWQGDGARGARVEESAGDGEAVGGCRLPMPSERSAAGPSPGRRGETSAKTVGGGEDFEGVFVAGDEKRTSKGAETPSGARVSSRSGCAERENLNPFSNINKNGHFCDPYTPCPRPILPFKKFQKCPSLLTEMHFLSHNFVPTIIFPKNWKLQNFLGNIEKMAILPKKLSHVFVPQNSPENGKQEGRKTEERPTGANCEKAKFLRKFAIF